MTEIEPLPAALSRTIVDGKYELRVNEFIPIHWCTIFNTEAFFRLHQTGEAYYFQLCSGSPARPLAVAHFTEIEPGYYRSPRRGTFGGFEFQDELRLQSLEGFIDAVEKFLVGKGASRIDLLDAPAILNGPGSAMLFNVLQRKGYQTQPPELDYALAVDKESLLEKAEYNIRKRINKCSREGIVGRVLEPQLYRQAYEVIVQNRTARGFPITMSFEAISEMGKVFPGELVFFGAFVKEEMIAASICVKVTPKVLYVFYWGDLPGYQAFSPVCTIAEHIYAYARQNGFGLIDLGTSTKDGVPNYGLINFKRELGGVASLKLSYRKQLA